MDVVGKCLGGGGGKQGFKGYRWSRQGYCLSSGWGVVAKG